MRPATAYSADGPANLLQAVTAAASPLSKDRGALITMNDRVGSAWYTQKTHGKSSLHRLDRPKLINQSTTSTPSKLLSLDILEASSTTSSSTTTLPLNLLVRIIFKSIYEADNPQSRRPLTYPTSPLSHESTSSTVLKNSMLESWRPRFLLVMSRVSFSLHQMEVLVPTPLLLE
jgi:hypothetical protein